MALALAALLVSQAWAQADRLAQPAGPAPAAAQEIDEEDIVFTRAGGLQQGTIVGLDGLFLKVEIELKPEQPPATLSLPRFEVAKIQFGEHASELAMLEKPAAPDLPALWREWERKRVFLRVPNSNAGAFGLACARLLLESASPSDLDRAFALFAEIEARDWDEARNSAAKQGRLRAMIRLGRAAEAVAEARQIAETSDDPGVLIEARYVLAEAAFREFRDLLEENPRWEDDPRVRPERERLYHETLDLLLYPYLFHGSDREASARGLWRAVELYRLVDEPENAAAAARDIAAIYPGSEYALKAGEMIEHQQPAPKEADGA